MEDWIFHVTKSEMALERDKFVISWRNTRLVISLAQRVFNSTTSTKHSVSQVHFVVVDLDVQRSPEQQQLVKQYYKGFIPHILVLDAHGTPLYSQSDEVESPVIEDILQKSLGQ